MAHAHIALNIQRRRSGEAEGFHIRIDLSLKDARIRPGASEARDELVVHGTALLIDQLNALVGPVVRIAIVHHNIKAI